MAEKRNPVTHRTPAQAKKHDRTYKATPKQKKLRAKRNAARTIMEKEGRVSKGDGKSVDHIKMMKNGGGNKRSNLRVQSMSKNSGHGTSPGGHKKK